MESKKATLVELAREFGLPEPGRIRRNVDNPTFFYPVYNDSTYTLKPYGLYTTGCLFYYRGVKWYQPFRARTAKRVVEKAIAWATRKSPYRYRGYL